MEKFTGPTYNTNMASSSKTPTNDVKIILSEQRKEFVAAQTLENDLNYAFNLQMEEALRASMALNPSLPSSSNLSSASSFPLDVEHRDDGITAFVEEFDRMEQEIKDREMSEAVMRNVRDDLNRRIHDQKVASAIYNMPNDVWMRDGDWFEKPYGEGSSSSSSSAKGESFRVYVKGLVSEERVKDATVNVAGIGVAICDSKDYPMFELRKPLGDDCIGKNALMSSDEVGIRAFIEGLSAAIDLDLKRVTCFCDEIAIHHYVMGGQQPPQSIFKLVHDVMLLKTKFVQFSLVLAPQNSMAHALKLAREATLSRTRWPSVNDRRMIMMETCIICYEDTVSEKMFSVDSCFHRFCLSCMKQHAEAKLLSGTPAKCPHEGCKTELNIDRCEQFLDRKKIDIMRQRKKEASIPVNEKVYCPYPKCSFLMSKTEVLEYTKTFYNGGSPPSGARKCIKCQSYQCIDCKAPWHYGMDCKGFKTSNAYHLAEDGKLESLASKKLWRQCGKCNNMVELAQGCYHIYCRCGHEFCYRCGAGWKDKKATCECPLWDERAIVYNNDPRRRG